MTTLFGWCFGPEGSTGDHDSCPYEIGAGGSILRCGCACHEQRESARIVNQARENGVSTCDNESGPEGALTPTPALTPHHSTNPRSAG
jgi:hypothetical protein